ncbi:putative ABC transporter ATP-binding protein YxlF [Mucilaginibacter gotjawali]|uniref:Putative ABC transporter ATP-binding protein YxlF n=1 Tax=Mucilaginibacter gotjawali TaxID=1550579 RepID=A0A120MY18_9SPHI|nr:putative ABC transporter ATP-binding protein YxlF [Mucilaginibacter gotjawali]
MAINNSPAINILHMGFRYPGGSGVIFSDLNLKVAKGERFGLFGPNGAGKTTLISLMTGLLAPDKGQIELFGHRIGRERNLVNNLFGFVPQDFSFYQELSPVENMEFFGAWSGLDKKTIRNRTDELLQILGLEEVRNKQVQNSLAV